MPSISAASPDDPGQPGRRGLCAARQLSLLRWGFKDVGFHSTRHWNAALQQRVFYKTASRRSRPIGRILAARRGPVDKIEPQNALSSLETNRAWRIQRSRRRHLRLRDASKFSLRRQRHWGLARMAMT
jgi:hypothetical protein